MELADGFTFVGAKVRLQVGDQDFEFDLPFFPRDLQCPVAFELKTSRFEPEHMEKLTFSPEALDSDRRRRHEKSGIGVLLRRTNHDDVVDYALSRLLLPALVTQHKTTMVSTYGTGPP